MTLDRTIIIPGDNVALARKLFDAIVYKEDVLVVVVLGEGSKAMQAVQSADKRAKVVVAGFERKVAWIRNRDILKKEIAALKPGAADLSKEDMSKVLAFSISLDNTVMHIVHTNDEPNFLRMERAFLEAGRA
jgi:hypothetical protein